MITGGSVSSVQVTVRLAAVAAFPQASLTFHVRVWLRWQPVLVTALVTAPGVTGPQLSVALAVPSAASITAALGLQPSVKVVPLAVITGASVSSVQLNTCRQIAVPHVSLAV